MVSAIRQVKFTTDDYSKLRCKVLEKKHISPRLQRLIQEQRIWVERLQNESDWNQVFIDALESGFYAILAMTSEWVDCLEHIAPFYPIMTECDQSYFSFTVIEQARFSIAGVLAIQRYCSNDEDLRPFLPRIIEMARL